MKSSACLWVLRRTLRVVFTSATNRFCVYPNYSQWEMKVARLEANASSVANVRIGKLRYEHYGSKISMLDVNIDMEFNGGQEAATQEALELLIGLAGTELRFLRSQLVEVVGSMLQVTKAESLRRRLGIWNLSLWLS
ncbi:importin-5 isoform X1 [Tanacetum coccineum]|uniref:Importin-5 isoform X1 n=1 Tax=Tanacetum coccineum TaxID=301880 RepID=A0ABQ5BXJ3_9ASTR